MARGLDDHLVAVRQELLDVRDTARFAPPRRGARGVLERSSAACRRSTSPRATRVCSPATALRFLRAGPPAPEELPRAIARLADAVWELAASYDDDRREDAVRRVALDAAAQVAPLAEDARDLRLPRSSCRCARSRSTSCARWSSPRASRRRPQRPPTDELLTA